MQGDIDERRTGEREHVTAEAAREAAFLGRLASVLSSVYRTALSVAGDGASAGQLVESAAVEARREYADFRPGSDFQTWFLAHLATAFRRSASSGEWQEEVESDESRRSGGEAAISAIGLQDGEQVVRALQQVPAPERLAAALHMVNGYGGAQVAEVMGVRESLARTLLRRGRRRVLRVLVERATGSGLRLAQA